MSFGPLSSSSIVNNMHWLQKDLARSENILSNGECSLDRVQNTTQFVNGAALDLTCDRLKDILGNMNYSMPLLNLAISSLSNTNDTLMKLIDLAQIASDPTTTQETRSLINMQYTQLLDSLDNNANISWAGNPIFHYETEAVLVKGPQTTAKLQITPNSAVTGSVFSPSNTTLQLVVPEIFEPRDTSLYLGNYDISYTVNDGVGALTLIQHRVDLEGNEIDTTNYSLTLNNPCVLDKAQTFYFDNHVMLTLNAGTDLSGSVSNTLNVFRIDPYIAFAPQFSGPQMSVRQISCSSVISGRSNMNDNGCDLSHIPGQYCLEYIYTEAQTDFCPCERNPTQKPAYGTFILTRPDGTIETAKVSSKDASIHSNAYVEFPQTGIALSFANADLANSIGISKGCIEISSIAHTSNIVNDSRELPEAFDREHLIPSITSNNTPLSGPYGIEYKFCASSGEGIMILTKPNGLSESMMIESNYITNPICFDLDFPCGVHLSFLSSDLTRSIAKQNDIFRVGDQSFSRNFQTGVSLQENINVSFILQNTQTLGFSSTSIETQVDAQNCLIALKSALIEIQKSSTSLSISSDELEKSLKMNQESLVNHSEAYKNVTGADILKELEKHAELKSSLNISNDVYAASFGVLELYERLASKILG